MATKIKVFNNLTRSKEDFVPIEAGKVKFYSCGPTTYDFLHVGNARALVVGDLIHRIFTSLGYEVDFVRNFTDVDDQIINRANELGVSALEHSSRFVQECIKDMQYLGMVPASHTPKVSETMTEIIQMIEELVKNKTAYVVEGEVFYHTPCFKEYGKLSKKDLESLEHGIRVEVDSRKKHPSDFVLWKPAKPGEPAWDSPWGKGRPGWHIECSAMAKKFLGKTIDIHHGGVDLMFPHHENEIAQSEMANGQEFSKYWCHNEFLNFGSEKMSKSLGNVVTIRKFVDTYGGEVLRQLLISVHYRSKMDWSEENIEKAILELTRIHEFVVEIQNGKFIEGSNDKAKDNILAVIEKMKTELANDFNVPGAMAHFFALIRDVRRDYLLKNKLTLDIQKSCQQVIAFVSSALGCISQNSALLLSRLNQSKKSLNASEGSLNEVQVEQLLKERKLARANKNWARADEIRLQLDQAKITIKDNPDGSTSWSY